MRTDLTQERTRHYSRLENLLEDALTRTLPAVTGEGSLLACQAQVSGYFRLRGQP